MTPKPKTSFIPSTPSDFRRRRAGSELSNPAHQWTIGSDKKEERRGGSDEKKKRFWSGFKSTESSMVLLLLHPQMYYTLV
jgi:hypothetical protein